VDEVTMPFFDELQTATIAGFCSEALAYHRGDLQDRWDDYGKPTRLAIGRGLLMTAADFVQAQRVRRAGLRELTRLYDAGFDLMLTPTTLVPPSRLDALSFGGIVGALLTPYWNAAGYPAMSIPMGLTSAGLPVGLQLAGRPFDEATVLQAADAFQLLTDHHLTESPVVLELLS
jgi:aspartyl-tRNA(Asn)/glutamyl-tRNA(Gln) amidotransferase subunit A